MKKFLIAILLIVPLIVLLSINVSGKIISGEITINIENLTLTHKGNEISSEQIILEEYTENNKKFQLFVDYYPRIAQNKSIVWESSDESVATVNNNGVVTFIDYGSVAISATAASNTSCKANCTFYVIGETISRIDVSKYNEAVSNTFNLKKYEVVQLKADIVPNTSLGSNKVLWSSNNEGIVEVDDNGVLTAKAEGSAIITIEAQGIKGPSVTKTVNVEVDGEMLSVTNTVYTSSTNYDLSQIITDESVQVYVNNHLITNKIYDIGNADSALVELRKDDHFEYVTLYRKTSEYALAFENIVALQKGVWGIKNYIPQGGADIVLQAVATSGELPDGANIIWSSNNQNVLRVINGRLYGESAGIATVKASLDGYEAAELEITVAMPINYISLEYDTSEDKLGLAEERVFGIYSCKNREISNTLKMNFKSTYPNVLNIADYESLFEYSSSNEDFATVNEYGVVSFSRAAIDKTVTITVSAKFSPLLAQDSYTFKVVDGINIGIGYYQNIYDKEENIMPSFEPFDDIRYIANEYRGDFEEFQTVSAIVMHTNIYYRENLTGESRICLSRSIYGNGYKLDGQMHSRTFTSRMFESTTGGLFNPIRPLEIVVQNLSIQSYAPISDDSEEAFSDLTNYGGMPWYKSAMNNEQLAGITHIFRYCLFQYAYSQMELSAGKTILDGCIFRNTAGPAIVMQTGDNNASDLTVKNCIFSNSIAPAILTTCGVFLSDKDTRSNTKYFTFRMEGENYVYNWKKIDEEFRLDIIPTMNVAYKEQLALYEALNSEMANWFLLASKDEHNEDSFYNNLKGQYFNFGFLFLPLWVPNYTEINPDPEHYYNEGISVVGDSEKIRLDTITLNNELTNSSIVKGIVKLYGICLIDYPMEILLPKGEEDGYNTMPDETYELNEETIAKLHGRYNSE